jgi:chromosome partitioning protein
MVQIIAVTNQKGGEGKTTTAVNISACLAAARKKTLLVDMDPQGNASSGVGVDMRESKQPSIYEVLVDDVEPKSALRSTFVKHLHVLPATIDLVGAEMEMIDFEDRAGRLKSQMASIVDDYDYVIIDSPPSLGLLTLNVLTFAHQVLVPVQSEYYALEGLTALMNTIERVRGSLNPDLGLLGLVITMYDGRTNLAQQVFDEVKRVFAEKVFQTVISRNIRLSESASFGQPVIFYDLKSRGAQDYIQLCQEIVDVCEKESAGSGA